VFKVTNVQWGYYSLVKVHTKSNVATVRCGRPPLLPSCRKLGVQQLSRPLSCKTDCDHDRLTNACCVDSPCMSEYIWRTVDKTGPPKDVCSFALPELYPLMELWIAWVYYNGNHYGIKVHTPHSRFHLWPFWLGFLSSFCCRRFDLSLLCLVAVLTMNHVHSHDNRNYWLTNRDLICWVHGRESVYRHAPSPNQPTSEL